MTLNTSEKVFHNLMLYFLLPWLSLMYIHRRSHISCWCLSIRGCLAAWRSFLGFWSCRRAWGRWFRWIVCRGRHSHPGRDSWSLREILRIRRVWWDRGTDHGCRLSRWGLTADLDGRLELQHHWLLQEDLSGFEAQATDLWLEQLHVLSAVLEQLVYDLVHVDLLNAHGKWNIII